MSWLDGFKGSKWAYRYRYDNQCGAFLIEYTGYQYVWCTVQVIENNRLHVKQFVTFAEAYQFVKSRGLDNVYSLVPEQAARVRAYEIEIGTHPTQSVVPDPQVVRFSRNGATS